MAFSPNVYAVRLNLPDIDESFPHFLEALSELQDVISRHEEKHLIDAVLSKVIIRAVSSFRREEEAMSITRDRMMIPHRTAHQKFLVALRQLRKRLAEEESSIGIVQDLKRDVIDWMAEHHLVMDATLGRHVRAVLERNIERYST